jgi:restriction endonuclease S subunit
MYKKLRNVAQIVSGYSFRRSVENDVNGNIFVLQTKNISANQDIFDTANLTTISDKSIRNPFFLKQNDILLVSRGSGAGSFRSAVFNSDSMNVMPSSSIHVIRTKDATIIPKYMSLYLNSPDGQKALLQIVTGGSYIQSILIKNLLDFEIPVPPIHIQKLIVALHENIVNQEQIFEKKRELQQTIINAAFTNLSSI